MRFVNKQEKYKEGYCHRCSNALIARHVICHTTHHSTITCLQVTAGLLLYCTYASLSRGNPRTQAWESGRVQSWKIGTPRPPTRRILAAYSSFVTHTKISTCSSQRRRPQRTPDKMQQRLSEGYSASSSSAYMVYCKHAYELGGVR